MPRYEFPAVSNKLAGRGETTEDTWEEKLYEYDRDKDWKKGEWGAEIGKVTIVEDRSPARPPRFKATFEFGDGTVAEYSGPIPGEGSWQGRSTVRKDRGPDPFRDEIEVDSVNPKRWG